MKKIIIVLCSMTLSCHSLFGADGMGSNLPLQNGIQDVQQSEGVNNILKSQYSDLSLKEKILFYFEDESERTKFESYIQGNSVVSQGIAAKILCEYCDLSPAYLPQKESCSDPYIGRLFLEYIWGNYSYDANKPITLEQWEHLYSAANQYRADKQYVEKALRTDVYNIKEKINIYKKNLQQNNSFQKVSIGTLNQSSSKLLIGEESYELYQFLNTTYVRLSTLESMGFEKQVNSNWIQLLWERKTAKSQALSPFKTKDIMLNNQNIYIGPVKTYSLSAGNETFIPIRALEVYFDISAVDGQIMLNDKYNYIDQIVSCNNTYIINKSSDPIRVSCTDLYWNGSSIIKYQSDAIQIEGNGKYLKNIQLYALRGEQYLTTIINSIETNDAELKFNSMLGQDNELLIKKYNEILHNIKLANEKKKAQQKKLQNKPLFPASVIIGTMKYSTNGFSKSQKVEVWAAEDKIAYYVKDSKNKTIKIPWNSISIPKNPPTANDKPTKAQIEAFINSRNISSRTVYLVWTDLYRQKTYVFKGKKNDWHLIKTLVSSTGNNKTPTPRGLFELTNRVPYFGVDKGYRCKNAFQIFDDYMYHSILFDKTGSWLLEGTGILGRRASHGCIRFSEADSLWFYNTLETHSTVWIN